MKKLKWALAPLLLIFSLSVAFQSSQAQALVCSQAHRTKWTIQSVGGQSPEVVRQTIIQFLRENPDVPSFLKTTPQGDVPVIMLNPETLQKLKPLLNTSAGYMFVQQVGYRNDHGLMRSGPYIIDADTPGARGYGEIHATGLAWKDVNSYIPRRQGKVYVMIETGILLPPEDYKIIHYYQMLRRAAIFRVPFTFGGVPRKDMPNMLSNLGENCFGFCKGAIVNRSVAEIRERMVKMGAKDVDQLMADPAVVQKLADAMELIQKIDPANANELNWAMFNGPQVLKDLDHVIPKNLSEMDKQIFVNWIFALDASQKYSQFLSKYKVSSNGGYSDMNNGVTSFVLIYDSMHRAEEFKNGTYQSPGVFYNWLNQDQKPLQ